MSGLTLGEPQPFLLLAHHAAHRPDAIALSTFERDFTYAEAAAYATSIAGLLRRRGVRPGQLVGVQLRNELNLLFMEAVYHEAAVWCTLGGASPDALGVAFDWLLAHEPVASFAPERTIFVDDAFMVDVARADHYDAPLLYPSLDAVCRVTFSSGTTGVPLPTPGTVARQARAAAGWMLQRPFFSLIQGFSGSAVKIANACIYEGDTYICPGSPDENVSLAQRNFVATLQGSPIQLTEFLDCLDARPGARPDIATVQFIGGFLTEQLLERIRGTLGASVTACYGSTEVGMITMRENVTDDLADVGAPLPGVSVEVVDDDGRVVPTGVEGRVRVRTERRRTGYFGVAPAGHDATDDGWFSPGDLGHISAEGHLVLAGRASEVINAGGVKFSPDRVDATLTALDGVRDGVVIPVPAADGLSGYAAVVVVDDDFDMAALVEPLTTACGGVAPTSLFRVASLGRDQNGKISRASLASTILAALA